MTIVQFIESLREDITHSDVLIKNEALKKLSCYLNDLSFSEANSESVNCLVEFYVNILDDHFDLLPSILDGLLILIDFINFSDINAVKIASTIVKLDVPQYKPTTRHKIYELLDQLFTYYIDALKSLKDDFLRDFISIIDGENSPICVYLVMKLNKTIITNLKIDNVYQDYFDSISAYFPVEFKTNKSTITDVNREKLVDMNKQCMIASPLFGQLLFPILLEKLTADKKSARMDALNILTDSLDKMYLSDVLSYHMSFMDCLLFEVKNRDTITQQLALVCVDKLSRIIQDKADEKDVVDFCFHLYDIIRPIVDNNDEKCLLFLQAAVDNKLRIWCGLMAHLLPPLVDKAVKLELEDYDKLNMMTSLLAAGDNLPQYRGLINSGKFKVFFTRLHLLYQQLIDGVVTPFEDNNNSNNSQHHLSTVIKLLCQYSLFDVWIPECGVEDNIVTDIDIIIQSRCHLISRAMDILISPNNSLQDCLLSVIPSLIHSSILLTNNINNDLTKLIYGYFDSANVITQTIVLQLLTKLPVDCLEMTLNVIDTKIAELELLDQVTECLSNIVTRFASDAHVTSNLCSLLMTNLGYLIANYTVLSNQTVTNLALALSQLGTPTDASLKSQIIHRLLQASKSHELSHPCIIWFNALLGQSPIELIHTVIKQPINTLFAMLYVADNNQLKSILYQNYASIINKMESLEDIESNFNDHLLALQGDVIFVLWVLKAAMLGFHHSLSNRLIDIIIDPTNLCSDMGSILVDNLEILNRSANDDNQHFCDERKLFPRQSLFYEQQSFQLIAQSYRRLAMNCGDNIVMKEITMKGYLKLVGNYPKHVIDLSMDEIVTTVLEWFSQLDHMSDNGPLRLQALKAICSVQCQDSNLSIYADQIADNIVILCQSHNTLTTRDRLFLVKAIRWLVLSFPQVNTTANHQLLMTTLTQLTKDIKRIVRIEAAKSKMVLFV